jgi:hypothetical protein
LLCELRRSFALAWRLDHGPDGRLANGSGAADQREQECRSRYQKGSNPDVGHPFFF